MSGQSVLMADLADRDAGDQLVHDAWGLWNGLDAWLHIAGADTLTGSAARLPFEAKLDLLWSVDVVATVRLCRAAGKRMAAAGSGAIVTMGWDQAETGMEGDSGELFATTKGAIMSFAQPGTEPAPRSASMLLHRAGSKRLGAKGRRSRGKTAC